MCYPIQGYLVCCCCVEPIEGEDGLLLLLSIGGFGDGGDDGNDDGQYDGSYWASGHGRVLRSNGMGVKECVEIFGF